MNKYITLIVLMTLSTSQAKFNRFQKKRHDVTKTAGKDNNATSHLGFDLHSTAMTKQIEKLLRTHAYEMSVRPNPKNQPVVVGVAILIESISDISEVNMDLTFTLRIWKSWVDERLKFKGEVGDSIVLPSRLIEKLWVPDLFIVGSKKSFIHRTTVDNIMLRLYRNGTISYRAKITTTVACQMNLYNFPLDIENCTLAVQSLAYTNEELQLEWRMGEMTEDLFMNPRLVSNMPKFKLVHHKLHTNNVSSKQFAGMISQLRVSFELQRYLLSVFFQSYFPAIIMVILAGLGMWLDPRSVPARVAMGITSVLTISTIITGLKNTLPKVSYLTAMDLYLWTCFLFVFSTVLEYCVLNYVMTIQIRRAPKCSKGAQESQKNGICNGSYSNFSKNYKTEQAPRRPRSRYYRDEGTEEDLYNTMRRNYSCNSTLYSTYKKPRRSLHQKFEAAFTPQSLTVIARTKDVTKLDVFFRILYFLSFIIFNIVYWCYYVISTQHEQNDDDE